MSPPPPPDQAVVALLESLGFEVIVVDDDEPDLAAAVSGLDPAVVGVSSSVVITKIGTSLRDLAVPMVVWEGYLFDEFGFTAGGSRQGESAAGSTIVITDGSHPITAPLIGTAWVTTVARPLSYGRVAADVHGLAEVPGIPARKTIMVAEAGDEMAFGPAPATRVGLWLSYASGSNLTPAGEALVGRAFTYAAGGPPVNVAPVVDAGGDVGVALPVDTVVLDATVSDDGLVDAVPSLVWSGPPGVVFSPDVTVEDPTVSFPGPGLFSLTLTAHDGELSTSDVVEVTVAPLSTSEVSEGENLYFTDARVSANPDVIANSAHRAAAGVHVPAGCADGQIAEFDGAGTWNCTDKPADGAECWVAQVGGVVTITCPTSTVTFDAAPPPPLAVQFGGTSTDAGRGVTVDGDGNVYTTGHFVGTADFDPGAGFLDLTSMGGADVFVSKLSPAGELIWAVRLGGSGNDVASGVAVDGDGNVYTTGYFGGTADFDPGPGTLALTSAGGSHDVFVSKLSAGGELIWAGRLGGTSNDYGYGIAVDGDGNVYTTGEFSGTADFDPGPGTRDLTSAGVFDSDVFVSKLDSAGDVVWARRLGGTSNDLAWGVTVDDDGFVYSTGRFVGTADFDPGPGTLDLSSAGGFDVFVWKLGAVGDLVWAGRFGGTGVDEGRGVSVDGDGNVYTTGHFVGTADFDPGPGTVGLSSAGGIDVFVSKLDSTGALVWVGHLGGFGNDRGYGVAVGDDGSVHSTGVFEGTADFDPGPGTVNLPSAGSSDVFVSKLNPGGDLGWARQLGGAGSDFGNGVAVDGDGNVYAAGQFEGTAEFDPGPRTWSLTSAGNIDAFVTRLNAAGNL